MDLDLHGRRAFVSGSTQGIGYAIAEALLREGVAVTVNGRVPDRVDAAVASLRAAAPAGEVNGIAADLAQPDEVSRLLVDLGDVDILVNNAGVFEVEDFAAVTDAVWQRYWDVNVMSGVRLSRHLLGGMTARGWGRILFISSESGVNVPADMIPYGATKAAALAIANGLAKLTRGTAVTVNSILGGPTYSDGVAQAIDQLARAQAMDRDVLTQAIVGANRTSLVERFLAPSEIANLAVYLASPRASATNGAAVRADGGTLTTVL
ncbi:SDR family NAD(P)-dependent oxidoreductase [Microbacterium stercoris]|uniref:SDR family NAD(P)-dependent oxidoreductase n=1 Tax=Microbacterium stercoris TaxID=2820289 RepID=A0A939QJH8_9MICO|nr:SDR family NAD(P)-dependent oxidoreductase [Microbacterium stercoris]MBO3664057.1 SDR family NAD(P)-dependent oxidoreductase [Microbacterium stercoris]